MRRDIKDESVRGFLAINAMLREEAKALRHQLKAQRERKYNPNWITQPRAPRGGADGGQWIDGGSSHGTAPKQLRQPRPVISPPPQPRPAPHSVVRLYDFGDRVAANDDDTGPVSIPLRASPLAALTLPLPLYGDTPRPTVIETRQVTPDLLMVITESFGRRTASFARVVTPEREAPLVVLGIDTGLTTTVPARLEYLNVFGTVEGDRVSFDPRALRLAYGRDIRGITDNDGTGSSQIPRIVPSSPEERLLDHNLRRFGADQDQINTAIQQLRNNESEGESFAASLRRLGASRDRARLIVRELRSARGNRPYVPPSSGPLVEAFPGLARARGSTRVYLAHEFLSENPAQPSQTREIALNLIDDIHTIDPNYVSPTLDVPRHLPTDRQQQAAYLETLQAERAAALYRTRGDVLPLQMVTLRFVQQRADHNYPIVEARYERGEFGGLNREHAIGTKLDEIVRLELRSFYANIGLTEDDLLRVNRREYLSRRRFKRPDARVADIFFDLSLEDRAARSDQIEGFFSTQARPTYVIIIRPRQVGRTFLVTPRPSRYRRHSP